MGFRNLMEEVGLINDEPTTIYPDNSPVIQILNQKGSLASRSKFMDFRIFKVRKWIDEGDLVTTYCNCNTLSMAADIGTKALVERQFVFCRDLMNGYALVRAGSGNKPTGVSAMCISWEDLQTECAEIKLSCDSEADDIDITTRGVVPWGAPKWSAVYIAGCRITPVLVFWTGLPLHSVKFTFETGFELSSSWTALPCYGPDLNRNILDFMR
jgi:hypothetical protein